MISMIRDMAKWKTVLGLCLATLLLNPIGGAFADDADIRIMTQNVYEGTNFTEITSATTLPAFLGAVTLTRQNILATKPDVRAAAVAREIVREQPDLVALQEVAILRSGLVPITSPATPVATVEMDQLVLILAELELLGHPYNPVAILPNLDAQAPSSLGTSVRITDRTVILARANHWPDGIRISNAQVQDYLAIFRLSYARRRFDSQHPRLGVGRRDGRWTQLPIYYDASGANPTLQQIASVGSRAERHRIVQLARRLCRRLQYSSQHATRSDLCDLSGAARRRSGRCLGY